MQLGWARSVENILSAYEYVVPETNHVAFSNSAGQLLQLRREPSSPATPKRKAVGSKDAFRFSDEVTTPERYRRPQIRPDIEEGSVCPIRQAKEESMGVISTRSPSPSKARIDRQNRASDSADIPRDQVERSEVEFGRIARNTLESTVRGHMGREIQNSALPDDKLRTDVFGRGRSRLSAWRSRRQGRSSTDTGSPVAPSSSPGLKELGPSISRVRPSQQHGAGSDALTGKQRANPSEALGGSLDEQASQAEDRSESVSSFEGRPFQRGTPDGVMSGQRARCSEQSRLVTAAFDKESAQGTCYGDALIPRRWKRLTDKGDSVEGKESSHPTAPPASSLVSGKPTAQTSPRSAPRLRPVKSAGSGVKAMAAMFERASKDEAFVPAPVRQQGSSRVQLKPRGVLSQYTVNPPPAKRTGRSPTAPRSNAFDPDRHTWLSGMRDSGETRRPGLSENPRSSASSEDRLADGPNRSCNVAAPFGSDAGLRTQQSQGAETAPSGRLVQHVAAHAQRVVPEESAETTPTPFDRRAWAQARATLCADRRHPPNRGEEEACPASTVPSSSSSGASPSEQQQHEHERATSKPTTTRPPTRAIPGLSSITGNSSTSIRLGKEASPTIPLTVPIPHRRHGHHCLNNNTPGDDNNNSDDCPCASAWRARAERAERRVRELESELERRVCGRALQRGV